MDDIKGDLSNGQAGTDSTLFVKTQTDLITAVGDTDLTLSDKTHTTSSVSVTHVITTGVGNGSTLTEFVVKTASVQYNRTVKAPFVKGSQNEYNIFHTFNFTVVL